MTGPYTNIQAIKAEHPKFFEKGALRFFNSKIYPTIYAGRLFITSEQFEFRPEAFIWHQDPRKWTIRIVTTDGRIEDYSEFQQFHSLKEAQKCAKSIEKWHAATVATLTSADVRALHTQVA